MAVVFDAEAARRLFEAVESLRTSPGAGKTGDTKTPVPEALADEFRMLMDAPEGAGMQKTIGAVTFNPAEGIWEAQPAGAERAAGGDGWSGLQRADGVLPVEPAPAPGASPSVESAHRVDAGEAPEGVRADAAASGADVLMDPTELYRLQFAVNMHAAETRAMTGIRDRAAADLDQMVRSTS